MTSQAEQLAQQLLQAQTRFWLTQLSPEHLSTLVREEVPHLYQQLDTITLTEFVAADKIKATAHRYALEMEMGGGIPELFGEIANLIYELPAQDTTTIGDIAHNAVTREFVEKAFESGGVIDRTLQSVQRSEPFHAFITDVVLLALKGYVLEENAVVRRFPFLSNGMQKLKILLDERLGNMQDNIEQVTRSVLGASIENTLAMLDQLLDQDIYRDQALIATLNLWDDIRHWPLSKFREFTTEQDLQEWMVLGYEFWRRFRETDYLANIIDTAVDFVFDKYGDDSLQKVVTEMGVTYDMIESEILRYSDDLASLLLKNGLAENMISRHLERFYFSAETLALLDATADKRD